MAPTGAGALLNLSAKRVCPASPSASGSRAETGRPAPGRLAALPMSPWPAKALRRARRACGCSGPARRARRAPRNRASGRRQSYRRPSSRRRRLALRLDRRATKIGQGQPISESVAPDFFASRTSEPLSTVASPTRAIRSFAASRARSKSKSPNQSALARDSARRRYRAHRCVDRGTIGLDHPDRHRVGHRSRQSRSIDHQLQVARGETGRRGLDLAHRRRSAITERSSAPRAARPVPARPVAQSSRTPKSPTCASIWPRNSPPRPIPGRRRGAHGSGPAVPFRSAAERLAGLGRERQAHLVERLRAQETEGVEKPRRSWSGKLSRSPIAAPNVFIHSSRRAGGAKSSPLRRSNKSMLSCLALNCASRTKSPRNPPQRRRSPPRRAPPDPTADRAHRAWRDGDRRSGRRKCARASARRRERRQRSAHRDSAGVAGREVRSQTEPAVERSRAGPRPPVESRLDRQPASAISADANWNSTRAPRASKRRPIREKVRSANWPKRRCRCQRTRAARRRRRRNSAGLC